MSINGERVNVVEEFYRLQKDIRGKITLIKQNVFAMRKISTDFRSGNSTESGSKEIGEYKNANHQLVEQINQLFGELKSINPQKEYELKLKEQFVKQLYKNLSDAQNKYEEYREEFEGKDINDK